MEKTEDLQGEELNAHKLREVSTEDLEKILNAHELWLYAGMPKEAAGRADLSHCSLRGKNLSGIKLAHSNLQGIDLRGSNLEGADLSEANLRNAKLHQARLKKAKLVGANLDGAGATLRGNELQDADLTSTNGLMVGHLAGTNLSGAKLPEAILKFEGLSQVEELSKNAKKLFVSMLLGCVYAWLTIGTTTDARLLTNSASSPLPIIQTQIPIAGFYLVAPFIFLALFIYFHLYLQRLWKELADLPAVFPDGKPLNEKSYPWLLNSLVQAHVTQLRETRIFLSRLEVGISILLAWWLVPFTLLVFWIRYLPRHDWFGTGAHIGLFVLAVLCALWFQHIAKTTLRSQLPLPIRFKEGWKHVKPYKEMLKRTRKFMAIGIAILLLAFVISDGAINGLVITKESEENPSENRYVLFTWAVKHYRQIIPKLLPYIGARAFADFTEQDVSSKPVNWFLKKDEELTKIVSGAQLKGMDLQYATAKGAFLVKGDLRQAKLQGANLLAAELQEADIEGAQLQGAYLFEAQLQKADLSRAQLQGAYMSKAKLEKAVLREAQLQGANLVGADLREADLRGAQLTNAHLSMANLQNAKMFGAQLLETDLELAKNLTQEQVSGTCADDKTRLPFGYPRPKRCWPIVDCALIKEALIPAGHRTITLKSDHSTMAASIGFPGEPSEDIVSLLDEAPEISKVIFQPAVVGRFRTHTPIPADAPAGTQVVNISPGDGRNGYFLVRFSLPKPLPREVKLIGRANVDDRGRVFLNGKSISPPILCTGCTARITQYGDASFCTNQLSLFKPGDNEIIISDANLEGGPSGGAFYFRVSFSAQ